MLSNKTLAIIGCSLLAVLLYRSEQRMDAIESKLDSIIKTQDTVAYTKSDLECLTKNIYYEAGVEPIEGKFAVAHVTINRLKSNYWGNTLCQVVYAKAQFSWTLKKKLPKPNAQLWAESQRVAKDALDGYRISGLGKSLFYHANYIKTPNWADADQYITQIGQHIFYKKAKNSWLEI
jgi:spore germination cell wall hydrolase CwlJ-like protein